MKVLNRYIGLLAGLLGSTLLLALFNRLTIRNSRKKILKKVDVFAEPFKETINEFIDILAVAFDSIIEIIAIILPHKKTRQVKREAGVRTTPGRYVSVKVQ